MRQLSLYIYFTGPNCPFCHTCILCAQTVQSKAIIFGRNTLGQAYMIQNDAVWCVLKCWWAG